MNDRLAYEHLMAGKLDSLPVPDMADAIWARIEAQLDIDLPTDDGGEGPEPPSAPPGPGIMGWGLSAVLLAFLSYFLLKPNEPASNPAPAEALPQQSAPQPAPAASSPPGTTPLPADNTAGGTPSIAAPVDPVTGAPASVRVDSAEQQPALTAAPPVQTPLPGPDSARQSAAPVLVSAPPPRTDTVPKKKGRGVSGLTDADYRIEPTKKKE